MPSFDGSLDPLRRERKAVTFAAGFWEAQRPAAKSGATANATSALEWCRRPGSSSSTLPCGRTTRCGSWRGTSPRRRSIWRRRRCRWGWLSGLSHRLDWPGAAALRPRSASAGPASPFDGAALVRCPVREAEIVGADIRIPRAEYRDGEPERALDSHISRPSSCAGGLRCRDAKDRLGAASCSFHQICCGLTSPSEAVARARPASRMRSDSAGSATARASTSVPTSVAVIPSASASRSPECWTGSIEPMRAAMLRTAAVKVSRTGPSCRGTSPPSVAKASRRRVRPGPDCGSSGVPFSTAGAASGSP